MAPQYPQTARDVDAGVRHVTVRVIVGPDGKAASESVIVSSGRADLDNAALRAAAASTYSPQRFACVALTGSYDYAMTLDPQKSSGTTISTAPCNQAPHEARAVLLAPRIYPDAARDLGLGPLRVVVHAIVAPNGRPEQVTIARSSGFGMVDRAAIQTAMRSTYTPATDGCNATEGKTTFPIDFVP